MSNSKAIDYKKLSAELDEILDKLQTNDNDIDDAVKLYDRGMQIIKDLEVYLKTAENKVTKLKVSFEA